MLVSFFLQLEAERALATSEEDMGTSEQSPSSSQRLSRRRRRDETYDFFPFSCA